MSCTIQRQRLRVQVRRTTAILALPLLLLGCQSPGGKEEGGGEPSSKQAPVEQKQMEVRVEGAKATREGETLKLEYPVVKDRNAIIPDWVINPGMGGVLGSVGVAAKSRLGTKEQLNEARVNARLELGMMLEARLQNVGRGQLEQQVQAVGEGLQDTSRKSILNIDRNIADLVLAGSRQRALWFDPNNDECFLWMVLDGGILEKVDHYVQKDVSIFLANTPITTEYVPQRMTQQPPKVIVQVPEAPKEQPKPEEPKTQVEKLEGKLKEIETIPIKSGKEKENEGKQP